MPALKQLSPMPCAVTIGSAFAPSLVCVGGATSRATAASGDAASWAANVWGSSRAVARSLTRFGASLSRASSDARTSSLRWLRAERSVSASSTITSVEIAAAPHARRQMRNMIA